MGDSSSNYGQIYATAVRHGSNIAYLLGGEVFASTDHSQSAVDGGTMTAHGQSISFSSNYGYISPASVSFGATSAWGLAGNSQYDVPAFTDSMYLPSLVTISQPTYGSSVSKSTACTVTWNTDSQNDTVIVGLRYNSADTRFLDSTAADMDYSWYVATTDDGSYTIPSSALTSVPTNGLVDIVVARGNSKRSGTNDKPFSLYGYAMAIQIVKAIQ